MIRQYIKQLLINYNLSQLFKITQLRQLNKTFYRRRKQNQVDDISTTNYIHQINIHIWETVRNFIQK